MRAILSEKVKKSVLLLSVLTMVSSIMVCPLKAVGSDDEKEEQKTSPRKLQENSDDEIDNKTINKMVYVIGELLTQVFNSSNPYFKELSEESKNKNKDSKENFIFKAWGKQIYDDFNDRCESIPEEDPKSFELLNQYSSKGLKNIVKGNENFIKGLTPSERLDLLSAIACTIFPQENSSVIQTENNNTDANINIEDDSSSMVDVD